MKNISIISILIIIPIMLVSQGIRSESNIVITSGTSVYVDGNLDINAGEVQLDAGSELIMGNNRTLSVNNEGNISLLGTDLSFVTVTSPGYFSFNVNSGGNIAAQYALFERMGMNGLDIKAGAIVDPDHSFQNSTFQNGQSAGNLLTINNSQDILINGAVFPSNTWGGASNVSKSINSGYVTFTGYSGGFGGAAFESDPYNRIYWSPETLTHTVNIPSGWSGLSSYIMPVNNDIVDVFAPILSEFVIAETMTGFYYPAGPVNTIIDWESQSAYKIKMNAPADLPFMGNEETNKTFGMNDGWSLVPVISNIPVDAATLFGGQDYKIVKDVAGLGILWPEFGINTLGAFLPGRSYFALMNSAGSVAFPPNAKDAEPVYMPELKIPENPWTENITGPSTHVVAILASGFSGSMEGDVIGIFAEDGHCYGISEIQTLSQNAVISAYADDPYTYNQDGFIDGDKMEMKLFRPLTNEIFEITAIYENEQPNTGFFESEGVSVVTGFKVSSTGISGNPASAISLYPNPTNGMVEISGLEIFDRIEIFNSGGELVKIVAKENETKLVINLSDLPSGVYQIKFTGQNTSVVKKLIRE